MRMTRRKLLSVFVAFWLVAAVAVQTTLVSCAHRNVTIQSKSLPAGVSEAEVKRWFTATGTLLNIAQTSSDIQEAVLSLNKRGAFPDGPEYVATLKALAKIKLAQITAANYLRTVTNTFGQPTADKFDAHVRDMLAAFEELVQLGLVGIKDETTKATVMAIVEQLRIALQILQSVVAEARR